MYYGEKSLKDNNGNVVLKAYFSSLKPTRREFRKHHHAECELAMILEGDGVYSTERREYHFCPGSVFLFSTDEVHCITEIHSDLRLLNIRFMPSFLVSEGGSISFLKILFSRNESFENLIDPKQPATERIRRSIIEIERELDEHRDGYDTMVRYRLFSCFAHLVRDYGQVKAEDPCFEYKNSVGAIGKALRFIDENIEKPITLSEISAVAAMSPTYFSTVFKNINGLSPWRYITIKRVERAVELLRTTELSKLEIAAACGFTSSSNFYKAFKAITGKRPKDLDKR